MIIALSGHIKSGKNTVANIIQYLTSSFYVGSKLSFDPDINYELVSQWRQKAFAGKLKQIVSILTGIPVKDLDKQEVKERVLGEEWNRYRVITKGFPSVYVYSRELAANEVANAFTVKRYVEEPMTVRQLLQEIGTEAMRNVIHPNIWCIGLFSDYKHKRTGKYYNDQKGEILELPSWLITDLRYPNELEAVKKRDGITIRIDRDLYKGNATIAKSPHISETALDYYQDWDFFIDNTGTLEELIEKVKIILQKLKII